MKLASFVPEPAPFLAWAEPLPELRHTTSTATPSRSTASRQAFEPHGRADAVRGRRRPNYLLHLFGVGAASV